MKIFVFQFSIRLFQAMFIIQFEIFEQKTAKALHSIEIGNIDKMQTTLCKVRTHHINIYTEGTLYIHDFIKHV